MATSSISISVFFTLLFLGSSTAVFGLEIPTEENTTRLQNDQALDSVDLNCTARIEHLEETGKTLIKTNLEQSRVISAQNETLEKLTGILSWVQNQQPESKAGRNVTGILDKKLNSIQREFEEFKIWQELKKNASNFQSLRNNIANTTTCGGFITVKNEHEIRYQVPSQENRNESQPQFCIWVIRNSRRHSLVLKLTDIEEEQDFKLWTISDFSRWHSSETQEIRVVGETWETPEPYFALYFRMVPTATDNNEYNKTMSFNLNIKSNTISRAEDETLVLKRIDLSASPTSNSTSSFQSFRYPLAPSTTYSANERTFIILKPTESGSRLWLRMKSLQTVKYSERFEIMTFSGRPISRARISGEMRREREFRSGTDEPILVFFASDAFEQDSSFSFDYAEENNETALPTAQTLNTCGGLVRVLFKNEISYQVSPNETSSVCIWVVENELVGGLQVELADQNRWRNDESTELFIIHSIDSSSPQKIPINIQDPSVNFSCELDSYFLLYFRFNPNIEDQNQNNSRPQGFRLVLQGNSQDSRVNSQIVSHTELRPSSTPTEKKSFSYHARVSEYRNDDHIFIIIKPTGVGRNIKIKMNAMDLESFRTPVKIMSYSEAEQRLTIDFSFTERFRFNAYGPRTLRGRENEPVVIFFRINGADISKGFRFTYSEELSGFKIPPACGGFITVKNEHLIRYQVPSQQNRTEGHSKFCMWFVNNSQPQNLVLELEDVENYQGFQLWAISSSPDESKLEFKRMDALGVHKLPKSRFALYFRMVPTATDNNEYNTTMSFNLNIKSNTISPAQDEAQVLKRIDLSASPTSNSTPSFQSFKYPLAPSTTYSANERTFIILKPSESGSSLRLRMKSVQTRGNADWVEIVTFSEGPISRARFSGKVRTGPKFRSGKDEPILVFFGSDSSRQGSGFSFDYIEENRSRKRTPNSEIQSTCGGFVSVFGEDEISYQVPPNETSSVCIWVVTNELDGQLQVQLADQNRWSNDQSTELFIIHSIDSTGSLKLPINMDLWREPVSVSKYFLLYFRFNPNRKKQRWNQYNPPQGFRLRLQHKSQESRENDLEVSRTELRPSSTPTEQRTFSYPVGSQFYQGYERAFIIIKPTAVARKIKMDVTSINNFGRFDQVQIMSYSEAEKGMTIDFYSPGTSDQHQPRNLTGRENEPFIVFFASNRATSRDYIPRFQFTYSEVLTSTSS